MSIWQLTGLFALVGVGTVIVMAGWLIMRYTRARKRRIEERLLAVKRAAAEQAAAEQAAAEQAAAESETVARAAAESDPASATARKDRIRVQSSVSIHL
jgi:sensor histidine kinase regulating citrate/malate metabolism